MNTIKTEIADLLIIEPTVFPDSRGYFFESFNQTVFERAVGPTHFVQDNESASVRGVLRGLHYQVEPFAQAKLVRVITGSVLDIVVDIRPDSSTYGKHFSIELSAENKKQLWVPKGFAHGYVVLSDQAIFVYKCDQFYSKESEGGIIWNDPQLAIDWKVEEDELIISEKDLLHPNFGNHRTQ